MWFLPSAAAALVLSLFDTGIWLQIGVFLLLSGLFLLFARPILSKFLQKDPFVPTNADRLIGQTAVVTETLSPDGGAVRADGQIWSARLLSEEKGGPRGAAPLLPAGSRVTVCAIEGVKLLVRPEGEREEDRESSGT